MLRQLKSKASYYSIITLFPFLFILYAIYLLNSNPGGFYSWVTATKFAWFFSIPFVFSNLIGLFAFSNPEIANNYDLKRFKRIGWNKNKKLIVSYVSYGKNTNALKRAISQTRRVLNGMDVNYQIEVVTDLPVHFRHRDVVSIVVLKDFKTANNTLFKARALEYAASLREVDEHTWIVHLDEESVLTESCVAGINTFINDNSIDCIGQGEIKYNSYKYLDNPFITAVDSIRTGDDLGRFRFQYKLLQSPVYGIHGSFIVINSITEKSLGFDVGQDGSLTEDTFFAFKAADYNFKFLWCNGYIKEQSPFTVKDLIKQRRRWLNGLTKLTTNKDISLKRRVILNIAIFSWGLSWTSFVATVINFLIPSSILPLPFHLLSSLCGGLFISVYSIGAYRNLLDLDYSFLEKLLIMLFVICCVPVSALIEAISVVYAIINPIKSNFEVIEKN